MKKTILSIVTLLILGGVGGGVYYAYKPSPLETPSVSAAVISDSLSFDYPEDPKIAAKEMKRLQQSFDKLRPKNPYIVIDTHANQLSYRTADTILFRATCSTGSGGVLTDSATGRQWTFQTPRGAFKVERKIENPWWRKPDWAFIEEGEAIPKKESERFDSEVLGDFAMGFGDGYFIHGTLYKRLLGISVTHGCVRLGDDDLKGLFKVVPVGTQIYIF